MNRLTLVALVALACSAAACGSSPPPAPAAPAAPAPAESPAKPADKATGPGSMNLNQKAAEGEKFKIITIDQLATHIAAKDGVTVYDANGKERYEKGHIPTAKLIDPNKVSPEELPADKQATLVFYCGGPKCRASHKAANAAITLGYGNVSVLLDGISGWEAAGRPLEKPKSN
jgi:rhodanese-related sulfurtransferase